MKDIIWFSECNYENKHLVGGKNASLGELYNLSQNLNFNISNGFAISTELYTKFLKENKIKTQIEDLIMKTDSSNIEEINATSDKIKNIIINSNFNDQQINIIKDYYDNLSYLYNVENINVAVRSSAVAEDMPNASFAGQQDTYLNISGIDNLLVNIKTCFASLFNSRAISYRKTHNIEMDQVLISVGIQKMIRSDIGSAGVAFSIDPESGYDKAIVVNSAFGLGELVVSGAVKPDEFILDKRILSNIGSDPIIMKRLGNKNNKIIYDKDNGIQEIQTNLIEKINFSLSNTQIIELGRIILLLEKNYKNLFNNDIGIDVEWALDGNDNKLYIIQTRPETVHSNNNSNLLSQYKLKEKSDILLKGVSVGEKISNGNVKKLNSISDYKIFKHGDILVTDMTTPDWEPIMKISNGIITNKGGRTCHAAIVARELQINAIVGTGNATNVLQENQEVTLSCIEGEGIIYRGKLQFEKEEHEIDVSKSLPVKLMLNVGSPDSAFTASLLPNKGVGLARLEFIITNYVEIHPNALCDYPNIREDIKRKIYNIIGNHDNGKWYFIKRLARGISQIASAFYPNDVIVRLSDFKSNEYKNLIGGELYEPDEENPMIGWRGASRYYSEEYKKGFKLECEAIKYVRNIMNLDNIIVMIPFCRTPDECEKVINTMKDYGLERGKNGLKIYLMCEIPSNVIEADNFSKYIDGVSIGGNDLLQLTLGVDRDSEMVTSLSDDKNISYRRMISKAISDYKKNDVKVGFCGQQPSDSIEFCNFLINEGIDSISITPDSVLKTISKLSNFSN
jgi:pyruvate,water dikinase